MAKKPGQKNYTPTQRISIATAILKYKIPARRVAETEGLPVRTVYAIVKRYKQQEDGRDLPRSGAPKRLDSRHLQQICRLIAQDPYISNEQIVRDAKLPCSAATLSRYLRDMGIRHKSATTHPKLSPEDAQKRLEFAQQWINENEEVPGPQEAAQEAAQEA